MTTVTAALTDPPAWAAEVEVTDIEETVQFLGYSTTLYSGLMVPDPEGRVDPGVTDLHLIAWQHNLDDVVPAGQIYIEVATLCGDEARTALILTAAHARQVAAALVEAADVIDTLSTEA